MITVCQLTVFNNHIHRHSMIILCEVVSIHVHYDLVLLCRIGNCLCRWKNIMDLSQVLRGGSFIYCDTYSVYVCITVHVLKVYECAMEMR